MRDQGLSPSSPWIFVCFLLMAIGLSLYPRIDQFQQLEQRQQGASLDSIPATNPDSYYWYRMARALRDGVDLEQPDRLRRFPDGTPYESPPAISRMMTMTAEVLDTSVYRAGQILGIAFSSLFVIPLGLYGWRMGYPAAGLLAALLASFSAAFFNRSHIHRVDTDGGNLFFVWLIALAMSCLGSDQRLARQRLTALASGLGVAAFCEWYAQPGFWILYALSFVLVVLALRPTWRNAAFLLAIFFVSSNPLNLARGVTDLYAFSVDYLLVGAVGAAGSVSTGVESVNGLVFPDVGGGISELERFGFWRALRGTLALPPLALTGLAGFAAFLLVDWRRSLPLLPMLILSGLGFFWASRFVMYASPLIGLGLGYLLSLAVLAALRRWRSRADFLLPAWMPDLALYGAGALLVFASLDYTAFSRRPSPALDIRLIESLVKMRSALPPESAVLTTWSHGYLVTDVTRAASFDDGRDPDDVVQQLFSRGLTSHDPRELASITGYLSQFGRAGLRDLIDSSPDYTSLLDSIRARSSLTRKLTPSVYLLFTESMLSREFSEHYFRGQWDFEARKGSRDGFGLFQCQARKEQESDTIICRAGSAGGFELDLATGMMNGKPLIKRVHRVRGGEVFWEKSYSDEGLLSFETIEHEGEAEAFPALLVRENVYWSNFNQMFVLGRFDADLFAEFQNDFPVSRSFQVLPVASH